MNSQLLSQTDVDTDALAEALSGDGLDGWSWATAGLVLVAGLVVARLLAWSITRVLRARVDHALAALIGRLVGYVVVVIALVYSLESLGVAIGPLLGALGIVGIALAFAFRDILENFIAGIMLQLQRPFRYGDEIAVSDYEGTVRDVGTRLVTVNTPDGETVKIPASTVVKSDINNYTERGLRRTTLRIGVAYGTDLTFARDVLMSATAGADGVTSPPDPEVLLDGFGESSIDFVVRFWHLPTIADHWHTKSNVAFAVDAALRDADITIPFPQRVLRFPDQPTASSDRERTIGSD
jgi:small conductance mechanosensitive channel